MYYHYYLKGYLYFLAILVIAVIWIFVSAKPNYKVISAKKKIAQTFLLTDYCLSTESRHTRHPNFPELIAPFQDFPGYHEHFPSSTFIIPRNIQQSN